MACPDQPGIVAAVASFVASHGGNIIDLQQHTDDTDRAFFQRVEMEIDEFDLPREEIGPAFEPVAHRFGMRWSLRFSDERARLGILASKEPHCLQDLLSRWRAGELDVDIGLVASNHPDHSELAGWFGVEYRHVPVLGGDRRAQERELIGLLRARAVDVVVLARYMQVLSATFCDAWPEGIINIHHSFLPAFQGAKPYHQAHERGVKLVGVTAHYATAELDAGPIIDQDVIRVSHRDAIEDLRRKGRDLEVSVLARAVRAHVSHRVLVYGKRTVVFD